MYNFDTVIDRRGTGSVRWDLNIKRTGEPDLIPLTTADMDFRCPDVVCDAVKRAADFGIFGYTQPVDSYYEAVMERFENKWNWSIKREWITYSSGIVGAIAFCIQGMTRPGDAVCILTPVYHPFSHTIENNGRRLVTCELIQETGSRTVIDFDDLERKIRENSVRMIIFCNPHNPVGRAWEDDELDRLAELCVKYGVILVSDEIHSDFVYYGFAFHSAAGSLEKLGRRDLLVVCSAASKSFNIAGLQTSNIIIPDERLRGLYRDILMKQHYMELNCIGPVATEAAYRHGEPWLSEVCAYLEGTRDMIVDFFKKEEMGIRPVVPESTFMMWLDCRHLGLKEEVLNELLLHRARVALNMGSTFGPGGEGYVRINFGAPRSIIREALCRIRDMVREL